MKQTVVLDTNLVNKMIIVRERLSLSGRHMSAICGFGVNRWYTYENANKDKDTVAASTYIMLQLATDCKSLLHLINLYLPTCKSVKVNKKITLARDILINCINEVDRNFDTIKEEYYNKALYNIDDVDIL